MAASPGQTDYSKKINSDFNFLTTHCADQNKKSVNYLKGCLFNSFDTFHGYASPWKQNSIKIRPDTDTV